MKRIASISLILLCVFALPLSAKEDGWRLDKDDDGIQIYTRAVEGSDYREIRGTTRIQGKLSSIVALLEDMSYWPKLNKVISSARVHERISETESVIHVEMDMPWPVSDRDVVNRRQWQQDAGSKVVTMTTVATTDVLPEQKDYVRIVQSTQNWTLTPKPDGTVELVWVTRTDPNGPIPAPIVNFLSVGGPHDSLTVLRAAIEAGEFSDARPGFIAEP